MSKKPSYETDFEGASSGILPDWLAAKIETVVGVIIGCFQLVATAIQVVGAEASKRPGQEVNDLLGDETIQ